MRVDATGWIAGAERVESKRSILLSVAKPLGIVWHWTGGGDPAALCRRIRALPPPAHASTRERNAASQRGIEPAAASWHLLIGRDGVVRQSAPLTLGTWHVGRSGVIGGKLREINRCTVGIELDNLGEVTPAPGGGWTNGLYTVGPEREVVGVAGHTFDGFPAAQVAAAVAVTKAIAAAYGFSRAACSFGHCDFDSPRKQDPGPVWRGAVLPRVLTEAGLS
jgi:hypothetical protein